MSEKQDNQDALLALADRIQEADNKPIAINLAASDELRRLVAENEALREANEAFGKRQEWWNDKMFALEERNAELVEALRLIVGLHGQWNNGMWVANTARAALAKAQGETK